MTPPTLACYGDVPAQHAGKGTAISVPHSLLSTADVDHAQVQRILDVAAEFDVDLRSHHRLLDDAVIATLFFEPSTRTRLSFEAAANRLGARVLTMSDPAASSTSKGETLDDTARIVERYADLIVLRHPQDGAAREVAALVSIPVINAGDGTGEHPTQALLDLFTIRQERGRLDGQRVALIGDLRNGRTVHSLSRLLTRFGCPMLLVSPPGLALPAPLLTELREQGGDLMVTAFEDALTRADVVYVTRIQKERFVDLAQYEAVRGSYRLSADTVRRLAPVATIMHPLPRVDEIAPDVDALPNAAYFRQAGNGVPVRMALLALLLGAVPW
ncbi:MAG TPA: aspartate carbamoyltransferase [Chloroflexota bacterium]